MTSTKGKKTSRKPRQTAEQRDARNTENYAKLTAQFVALMEAGAADPNGWTMPWTRLSAPPRNVVSKNRYQGVNYLVLAGVAYDAEAAPLFGTYDQWQAKHIQVRKGETGTMVVAYFAVAKRDKDTGEVITDEAGRPETFLMPRFYKVHGIWQCQDAEGHDGAIVHQLTRFGFNPDGTRTVTLTGFEADEACDRFFQAVGATVKHGGDTASYSVATDVIRMPQRAQFNTGRAYYSTFAHEHTHWTRHPSRLNRPNGPFGSPDYAREELIAELGAAFTMGRLGLESEARKDHADYLANWLQVLNSDPKALLQAASKASKATDLLFDLADVADEQIADDDEDNVPTDASADPQLDEVVAA